MWPMFATIHGTVMPHILNEVWAWAARNKWMGGGIETFAPLQWTYVTVVQTDRQGFPPGRKAASPNFTTSASVSSLTTWALAPGCSRRGRASCYGRTGSIFLLISATVRAFAFLSLAALLVGHFTGFECQVLFSTSINGSCQRCLTFLWTPFQQWTLAVLCF